MGVFFRLAQREGLLVEPLALGQARDGPRGVEEQRDLLEVVGARARLQAQLVLVAPYGGVGARARPRDVPRVDAILDRRVGIGGRTFDGLRAGPFD